MGSLGFLIFLLLASISINVAKAQTCGENSNVIQNAIGGGTCAVGVTDTANLELAAYVCAGVATMAPPPIDTRDIDSPLLQPKDVLPTPPSSFVVSQTIQFVGADSQTTKRAAIDAATIDAFGIGTMVTFSYNVPVTAIADGVGAVSFIEYMSYYGNGGGVYGPASTFEVVPTQTIFSVVETVTQTSILESTTTSTTTATDTDIFILAPSTSYSACTTGTATLTAKTTSKTTITSTTTPPARTITTTSVSIATTTLSCIPSSPPRRRGLSRKATDPLPNVLLPRDVTYEQPICGSGAAPPEIPNIYITTAVSIATVEVVQMVTMPFIDSTTISTTSTPLPTTVCNDVEATTTITPVKTSTHYTAAPRQTTFSLVMRYLTKTVVPKGIGKCTTSSSTNALAPPATVAVPIPQVSTTGAMH